MRPNLAAVGAYLRRLREESGYTVTQLAAFTNTGEGQIRSIEKGRTDTRGSMLMLLCGLLHGDPRHIAMLMFQEHATVEDARRVAEEWIAVRDQAPERAAAEERGEYQPH
jgi:transcriptional regulator with XRE-family HTH domain